MNKPSSSLHAIINRLKWGDMHKAIPYCLNAAILIIPLIAYIALLKYIHPTALNPNAVAQADMIKALLTGNISSIFNGVWGNILIPIAIIIHKIARISIEAALLASYQLSGIVFIYSLIALVKKLKFNLNIQLLFTILMSFVIAKIIKTSIISPDLLLSALFIIFYIQYDKWANGVGEDKAINKRKSYLLLLALLIFCSDQIAFITIVIYLISKLALKAWGQRSLSIREILNNHNIKSHIELIIRIIAIGAIFSSVYIVKYNQWHPLPLIRFNNQIGLANNRPEGMHPLSGKNLQALNTYNYFSNWDDPSTMTLVNHDVSIMEILKVKITNLNNNFNQSPNFISHIIALGAYLFLISIIVLVILMMRAAYNGEKNIKILVEIYIITTIFMALYAINYIEIRHFYLMAVLSLITIFYALNIIFLNPQYSWVVTILSLIIIRLNSVGLNFERYSSPYTMANNMFWQNEQYDMRVMDMTGASNLDPGNGLEVWVSSYIKNLGSVNTLEDEYWPEKIDALNINHFIYQQEVNYEIVNARLIQMGFVQKKVFKTDNNANIILYKRAEQ